MLSRRTLLAAAPAAALSTPRVSRAQPATPGVTATEIRIGNTMPYSGPLSAYGVIGKLEQVYWRVLSEAGGIAGRKINFITYDDGFSPPKTVEQARRLVEQDRVACLFNTLGTVTNASVIRYLNQRGVPHLFLATGADKWGNYQDAPWTIGWQPSYRTEAQIYMKRLLQQKPDAKLALLYQNDDFGKDYIVGMRDVLGDRFDRMVKPVSYDVTDPTIDSQVVSLQASGSDALLTAATPKFAAQAIRRVHDIGWRPAPHFLSNVSAGVAAVMQPAGPEKGVGVVTSLYLKDQTDPAWRDDPGMAEWRGFMGRHMPGADLTDGGYTYAYGVCKTMEHVLRRCGDDLSRENIMRQATGIENLEIPTQLPGIRINTSPTNYHPIRQLQLASWTGSTWERFGNVIEGAQV